jgi:hypothetical protein
MKGARPNRHSTQRHGHAVILVAISLTVLIGFVALAVDLGLLYVTRAELQRAADAAALAGASCYYTDAGLAQNITELSYMIDQRAQDYSLQNPTLNAGTILDPADIVIGTHDYDYPHAALDTSGSARFNAVRVTARRTDESLNGPVGLFFAGIFGVDKSGVIAEATAAVDDHLYGLWLDRHREPGFIPLTVDVDLFDQMTVEGNDEYSYEGAVQSAPDGVPELDVYPWKLSGNNPDDTSDDVFYLDDGGAGNFGILDFTGGGASATTDRILNGIPATDLVAEVGTSELRLYDDAGNPVYYAMSGGPGVTVSIADALEQRIGDVVGFFVHDGVIGTGTNAEYQMMSIRFGRIMAITLKGNPDVRRLVIQPVAYNGSDVMVSEYVPSTDGLVGRVMLVK